MFLFMVQSLFSQSYIVVQKLSFLSLKKYFLKVSIISLCNNLKIFFVPLDLDPNPYWKAQVAGFFLQIQTPYMIINPGS